MSLGYKKVSLQAIKPEGSIMTINKIKRLLTSTLKYEAAAFANLPVWYTELAETTAKAVIAGGKTFGTTFWTRHVRVTKETLTTLKPELMEFWESLQDVIIPREIDKVSGEEFFSMIMENFEEMESC